jgi:hypothetical protein
VLVGESLRLCCFGRGAHFFTSKKVASSMGRYSLTLLAHLIKARPMLFEPRGVLTRYRVEGRHSLESLTLLGGRCEGASMPLRLCA